MKKFLVRFLLLLIFIPITLGLVFYIWFRLTPFSMSNLPPLQNGDLVFQTIKAPQSLAITFATASPYTHIGMIKIEGDSAPVVVEAVGPVREISLTEWVAQGVGNRITISRIKNLKPQDAVKALNAATIYYGKPYDFYFLPYDDAIYCSELIYKAYATGSQITLGKEQSVEELNLDNFAVKDLIKERWRTYPDCSSTADFQSCYQIIMKQKLVSPASIAEDPNIELIYSDYGIFK